MRVWMPPKLKNKNHYALVMPGSVMGIMSYLACLAHHFNCFDFSKFRI